MKNILLFLFVFYSLLACQFSGEKFVCPMNCENQIYQSAGECPICGMTLVMEDSLEKPKKVSSVAWPDYSLYQLESQWQTQLGDTIQLKNLHGKVVLLTMIYTSCRSACPLLLQDMQELAQKIDDPNVSFVLVSIDPKRDTAEQLARFAKANELASDQWFLLSGQMGDIRELANVLAVKYARISPLDFSHANLISVLNHRGEMIFQLEGLNQDKTETVQKVNELLSTGTKY